MSMNSTLMTLNLVVSLVHPHFQYVDLLSNYISSQSTLGKSVPTTVPYVSVPEMGK